MDKPKSIAALTAAALIWSWANIIIKLLSPHFDAITQSFYRYIIASLFLLSYLFASKKNSFSEIIGQIPKLIWPSTLVTLHQVAFVSGVYRTSAVAAGLIAKLNVIFVPSLSFAFLVEERLVIKSLGFLAGTSLSLLGVVGVILGKSRFSTTETGEGAFLVAFSMLCWSIYAIRAKRLMNSIDPIALASLMPLVSCLTLFPLALAFGDVSKIVYAPLKINALLLISGIVPIGLGNALYYYSIKHLGASITESSLLVIPLLTGVWSFLVLDERLTSVQVAFGLVLILGCFITLKAKKAISYNGYSDDDPKS